MGIGGGEKRKKGRTLICNRCVNEWESSFVPIVKIIKGDCNRRELYPEKGRKGEKKMGGDHAVLNNGN